jgi:hypothetical protein
MSGSGHHHEDSSPFIITILAEQLFPLIISLANYFSKLETEKEIPGVRGLDLVTPLGYGAIVALVMLVVR